MNTKLKTSFIATAVAMTLMACSDSDRESGTLALSVTDAPVDGAEAVVVEFTGVEIQGSGQPQSFDFDMPKSIDLLQLTGSDSVDLLPETELAAGQYQWIRLKVNANRGVTDSYIDIDGARYSLFVPSGSETGLKLIRPFVIAAGGKTDFTIDFDLRKSIVDPQDAAQDYYLVPALRIVDNLEIGHINGLVDETLVNAEGCSESSGVYLFAGFDAELDDIDGTESDPITSTIVEMNADGFYEYEIGFVETGEYTLAFTCEAGFDDPTVNDDISFGATANVTVVVNQTVTVDF